MQNCFLQKVLLLKKNGIKVKINGKFEIEEIVLNPDLDLVKQQKILKECINEGLKKDRDKFIFKTFAIKVQFIKNN